MSVESDLRDAFLNNVNVSALVGTRFYPLQAPESVTFPAIVYQQTSGDGERTLGGVFVQQQANYQLRLIAESYDTLVQLKVAALEVSGVSQGKITDIDVSEGPDGFDYATDRVIKIMNVLCLT